MSCSITKATKGQKMAASPAAKKGDPAPTGFDLFVDETGKKFTIFGKNAGGNKVSIDGVATLAVVSANPAIATVAAPTGMTFAVAAGVPNPTAGTKVDLTATATWNDAAAGIGPFTITVTLTAVNDPVMGLTMEPTAVSVV